MDRPNPYSPALIERANGILMERHSIDEGAAFEMLRERSRIDNCKLIDLAAAVVDGHRLLPKQPALAALAGPRHQPAGGRRAPGPQEQLHTPGHIALGTAYSR
jgi:ANTAR domain